MRPRRAEGVGIPVKRCRDCGLVYSDPLPVPHDISDHYGVPPQSYWHEDGSHYRWEPEHFSRQIGAAKRLIAFQPGMTALDIGVGLGKATKSLAFAGFDVWGCEPSEPFRAKAIEMMGIDPARIQFTTVEEAHYPAAFFDFITFGAVLEHLYDPKAALDRAIGWLKPGGVLQVEVPNSNWLIAKLLNVYFRLRGTNYVTNISPMHSPFHLYEFTLDSFRDFEVAEHWFDPCNTIYFSKPFERVVQRYMKATDTGMQLNVFLRKRLDHGLANESVTQ